ncbi:MAG TPA: transposase [Thermoplasmata archaeon]|nr:transposase [Thermoplasmata archaeon]
MPTVCRALRFRLSGELPPSLRLVLNDYRVLVNEVLREALLTGKTARGSMSRYARDRALVHQFTGNHAIVASAIALSLVKSHRSRLRRGLPSKVPYVRRPFLRTTPETFHFDVDSGKARLSLRNGEWCSFFVTVAPFHREVLAPLDVRVKQLHVSEQGVVLYLEKSVPEPFEPAALLALDSNESSLDGVTVTPVQTRAAHVPFPDVRVVQARHSKRRRDLQRRKARDRRVARKLLGKEGRREHHRIESRLHILSKRLVQGAVRAHAAIALEDLARLPRPRRWSRTAGGPFPMRSGPRLRRRLSSWPRRELHRQIEYKAAERGVPIYWVNPFRTSTTCPRCGVFNGPRSRVGTVFDCASCHWSLDRQLNAGANIAQTVLRDFGRAELGGPRLDLDALSKDARRPRYPFEKSRGQGRSGGRGRDDIRLPGNRGSS